MCKYLFMWVSYLFKKYKIIFLTFYINNHKPPNINLTNINDSLFLKKLYELIIFVSLCII